MDDPVDAVQHRRGDQDRRVLLRDAVDLGRGGRPFGERARLAQERPGGHGHPDRGALSGARRLGGDAPPAR